MGENPQFQTDFLTYAAKKSEKSLKRIYGLVSVLCAKKASVVGIIV